ncbi:MAG: GTPase HflX [bacterium]|nr:GTPase HflX [bacterium]
MSLTHETSGPLLETAVIAAIYLSSIDEAEIDEDMAELNRLADTAGARVIARVTQRRQDPDPSYFLGKGKLEELKEIVISDNADLVIINNQLTPLQQRNMEAALEVKVVDRTALILDIFAQRARTREGQLQVELAQLNYLLPRLIGKGIEMSRLGGGIGTRGGPGETKLETDRRRIRRQIARLEDELEKVRKQRLLQSQPRHDVPVMVAALVGYTNAGKSTLFNTLTGADVLVENRLFATLDPTLRRLRLPNGQTIVLSDTVGFIRNLPHSVVAAFRATLEEVVEADIIIHVVDSANPLSHRQSDAVYEVLEELGVADKPIITVLNKVDLAEDPESVQHLADTAERTVAVSALNGTGLEDLLDEMIELMNERLTVIEVTLPYNRLDILSLLYDTGQVLERRYDPEGIYVRAEVDRVVAERIREFVRARADLS